MEMYLRQVMAANHLTDILYGFIHVYFLNHNLDNSVLNFEFVWENLYGENER